MRSRWLPLLPTASAVAIVLLIVGVFGFGIVFEIDEGTADPASARTPWGLVASGTYTALTFPLALSFWNLADAVTGEYPSALGSAFSMLGVVGFFLDAWLYGYVVATGIESVRARLRRRAV